MNAQQVAEWQREQARRCLDQFILDGMPERCVRRSDAYVSDPVMVAQAKATVRLTVAMATAIMDNDDAELGFLIHRDVVHVLADWAQTAVEDDAEDEAA